VDTDSFYVTDEHHDQAVALTRTPLGDGLRLKSSYERAQILGPRQIVMDGKPRIAGLPSRAQALPDGRYAGEVWSSLANSIQRGQPSIVDVSDRTWTIRGVDNRRVDGPDGWTLPITVRGGERVDSTTTGPVAIANEPAGKVRKSGLRADIRRAERARLAARVDPRSIEGSTAKPDVLPVALF
jgi:hypothetical protein